MVQTMNECRDVEQQLAVVNVINGMALWIVMYFVEVSNVSMREWMGFRMGIYMTQMGHHVKELGSGGPDEGQMPATCKPKSVQKLVRKGHPAIMTAREIRTGHP